MTTEATPPAQRQGNPTTPAPTSTYDYFLEDVLPKSVITLLGLGSFILIGVLVAKLADRFHDKLALRDDASDVSENTKDLLKTRRAVLTFSTSKIRSVADSRMRDLELARKFCRMWMVRADISRKKKRVSATALDSFSGPSTWGGNPSSPPTQTKVTLLSYKPKEEAIDERNERNTQENSGKQKKNDFIAIDIQNPESSSEHGGCGSTAITPHPSSFIQYKYVSEDVTIPVRVSTNDMPRVKRTNTMETVPPPPKVAYADSEFGSDTNLVLSPPVVSVKTPADALEIQSLSGETSGTDSPRNDPEPRKNSSTVKTDTHKSKNSVQQVRARTSGVKRKERKPSALRPITAGRSRPITPGGRSIRTLLIYTNTSLSARGRRQR